MPRSLIAVLGMHRSGTSATMGTIQRYGIEVGPVSERNRYNPRGNRELKPVVKFHDRILDRSCGSWWHPPEDISISPEDREERDSILARFPGSPFALKDPRMLLFLELWRDLEPLWIGVIRNPVSVRKSLEKRETEHGKGPPATFEGEQWEALWRHYNRFLLAELERARFPVIDFDRSDELDAQVRAALGHYGIEPHGQGGFFEPEHVTERADPRWRDQVYSMETVELWERLAGQAATPA